MSQATALLADAETSIKSGDWDQALEQLENLKKDQPSQPEVYEKLAHVLAVRGKFQSVITTYLELIKVFVEAENLEKADHAVTQVLALRPDSGEARERRIEIENKRGNTARAVYLSRELARLCIDQGDGERSIRLLQDALKHEPSNLDIALELAEMFVSHGHIQDGANQYRKVANAFQENGNIAKAAEAYRRMKVVQSDDPEVLLTLGRLYTELGKLDEAEQEFRSVLRHDLDHEQALLQLGLVCQLKGRFRSGILAFNKVLQNNPNLVAAKRKLGELHHSQGMMTEAVDFFLQAAQGHLEAEEKDDAIECFQIVLSVDENNAPAQQGLTNLGAPVQPKAFEPPQPPTPPEEEPAAAPEAPPPPVPFPKAEPAPPVASAPEPVGGGSGFATEKTERLQPISFDNGPELAPPKPEPAKPEPAKPETTKRPKDTSAGGGAAGAGGIRRGLLRPGLNSPGGDKPIMGGEKPMLNRGAGGIRHGLSSKTGGGGGPASDKPVLSGSDRRPTLNPGTGRAEPVSAAPAAAQPPKGAAFIDSTPMDEFENDMRLDGDIFSDPPASSSGEPAVSAMDDDFALPESDLFDAPAGGAALSLGGGGDLFDDNDDFPAPSGNGGGPKIGDLTFDSAEESGGGSSGLRPDYAQSPPATFGDEIGDSPFDFDADPDHGPQPTATPTLGGGASLFDDDAPVEDLFTEPAGGGDIFGEPDVGADIFGETSGDDLFGDPVAEAPSAPLQIGSGGGGLFDDEPATDAGGMFEGDNDPFANIFDEPAGDSEPAVDTIGGGSRAVGQDLFSDPASPEPPPTEADFDNLFGSDDEPGPARSLSLSSESGNDLFDGGGDFFSEPPDAAPMAAAPTISREPEGGLFDNDSSSADLFQDDDLFNTGGLNPGFDNPANGGGDGLFDAPSDPGGADLFSTPSSADDFDLGGGMSLDAPLDAPLAEDGPGVFDSPGGMFDDGDDSSSLFDGPESGADLFNEGPVSATDLFNDEAPVADDLFGEPAFDNSGPSEFADLGDSTPGSLFDNDFGDGGGSGLFESPESNDTLFDNFEVSQPLNESADGDALSSTGGADAGGLFDNDGPGGLFDDDNLFNEPAPAAPVELELASGNDDLFGDFTAPVEESDDLRLPLGGGAEDNIFGGEPDDGGSLFDLGGGERSDDTVLDALNFDEEPAPISIPDPVAFADPEPVSEPQALGGGSDLFGDDSSDDSGSLFDSMHDEPAPLDLDLPMPDDAPMHPEGHKHPEGHNYADSAQGAEDGDIFADPVQPGLEPQYDSGESLFADDGDSGSDLFAPEAGFSDSFGDSEVDAPLAIDIPQPVEESGSIFEPMDAEPISFALEASYEPVAVAAPPEPEEPQETDEFLLMLDSTLPPTVEEPSMPSVETEPISLPEAPLEETLEPVSLGVEDELFEPSLELMPNGVEAPEPAPISFEEPVHVEPDPVDLLSAEEKLLMAHTAQADELDASLAGADAASKIASYRKQLEDSPDNLVLRTRLADIHLKFGLLEDAVVQYRQVLRRNPDSIPLLHSVIQAEFWNENYVEAGDSLLALAKLHLKRGEQHEALDTLQSVLSLDPLHFEARKELVSVFTSLDESKLAAHHLRQLAETALTKGEVSGAILAFQQLLEISADPTFEERLAQIYESQGDVEKALSSFQSLLGRYRSEERWEEAARVTERIVEMDPHQLGGREELIALYQRLGHAEQAVEQQFKLARLYQEKGETERAIGLYEEVLKFQVDNHDARRHLVDAYLDAGRVSAALEQAEALTEHYLDTKDHNTAIYLYSRLVGADPENVELQERLVKFYGLAGDPENAKSRWIHISNLHEQKGRYDRAAEAVQKALELDEGQLDLLHRLALLYAERIGDNQAALAQLRKLFQLAPDRTDAVKMYIDLLLKEEQVSEAGQVLQRLEQAGGEGVEIKTNVIAMLRASVEANPGDLKARFSYGELCYHLGDLDHAIEQFQQTRRHPDFELISYNMLGLCFASKRGYMMLDLAIKQFQKGLETKGRPEQDYLETRYNLAMVQYQNGRAKEALDELKVCYNIDIAYRDVRSWIQKIEGELASGA